MSAVMSLVMHHPQLTKSNSVCTYCSWRIKTHQFQLSFGKSKAETACIRHLLSDPLFKSKLIDQTFIQYMFKVFKSPS